MCILFRLQNYTHEVQPFCAVVIIYSPSLPILFFSVYIILIFRLINKYQNINNVYKGLILFFCIQTFAIIRGNNHQEHLNIPLVFPLQPNIYSYNIFGTLYNPTIFPLLHKQTLVEGF